MDIGKIVTYEHIHELRVTYPNSDLFTGLTIGVRSSSSEQSKAIMRKHTNEQANPSRAKQKKVTAEQLENNELELTSACMAWWKWEKGDKEKPGDGLGDEASYNGEKPVLSMPIGIEVLGTVNWLYAQVKEASTNVENFMSKSASGSASSSANKSSGTPPETRTAEPAGSGTKPLEKVS